MWMGRRFVILTASTVRSTNRLTFSPFPTMRYVHEWFHCTHSKLIESRLCSIITFYFQNLVPGILPKPELEWDYNLGDIVLGMPVISEECESDGVSLVDRLPVIVTHALCHLIGHRHGNEAQWNKVCNCSSSISYIYTIPNLWQNVLLRYIEPRP